MPIAIPPFRTWFAPFSRETKRAHTRSAGLDDYSWIDIAKGRENKLPEQPWRHGLKLHLRRDILHAPKEERIHVADNVVSFHLQRT